MLCPGLHRGVCNCGIWCYSFLLLFFASRGPPIPISSEVFLHKLNPPLQLQCAQWLQSRCWMKPHFSPGRHQFINFRALSALCRELLRALNFSPATTPLVAVFGGRATHPTNRAKRCESHFDLLAPTEAHSSTQLHTQSRDGCK